MSTVLEISGLKKHYGPLHAISDLSFKIEEGEVVGLLGRNGAGKTTCIQCTLGLIKPTAGSIRLLGSRLSHSARERMGVCFQDIDFPPMLTVEEVLHFVAAHYPEANVEQMAERFLCDDLLDRPCGALSGGERRKVALAAAFVGQPRLVVLDEPTTGLDVLTRQALWREIERFRDQGGAVLVTSHYLEEMEAICDRMLLLDAGRIIREGSVAAIVAHYGYQIVSFYADAELPRSVRSDSVQKINGRYQLYTRRSDELVRDIVQSGVAFRELEIARMTLEDVFVNFVRGVE